MAAYAAGAAHPAAPSPANHPVSCPVLPSAPFAFAGEFRELCKALLELEEEAAAAPLLTVREAAAKQLCEDEEAWADEACGSPTAPNPSAWRDGSDEMGGDNWELI